MGDVDKSSPGEIVGPLEQATDVWRRHYSGSTSEWFWERVKALDASRQDEVYSLGCALQDLESRTMAALENAEYKPPRRSQKRTR